MIFTTKVIKFKIPEFRNSNLRHLEVIKKQTTQKSLCLSVTTPFSLCSNNYYTEIPWDATENHWDKIWWGYFVTTPLNWELRVSFHITCKSCGVNKSEGFNMNTPNEAKRLGIETWRAASLPPQPEGLNSKRTSYVIVSFNPSGCRDLVSSHSAPNRFASLGVIHIQPFGLRG